MNYEQWFEQAREQEPFFSRGISMKDAYEAGKAQREAELLGMGMGMEPVGYASTHTSCPPQFNKTSAEVYRDTALTIDAVYTSDQIAAARLQGAEEYRQKYNDTYSALDDCAREHSRRLDRITELEAQRDELLVALKELYSNSIGFNSEGNYDMVMAREAITKVGAA